jgi:hypothetical protein
MGDITLPATHTISFCRHTRLTMIDNLHADGIPQVVIIDLTII